MSVGRYIRIYLAVYGLEIIGGFGFEDKSQKTKAVCGLERKNSGGLRNVPHPERNLVIPESFSKKLYDLTRQPRLNM